MCTYLDGRHCPNLLLLLCKILKKNFYDDNDEYNLVGRLLIQPVSESIVYTEAISNQGYEDSEGHS
jgi:hypothetical protein